MSDLFEMVTQMMRAQVSAVQEGIELGRREQQAKARSLIVAYDRALLDPAARLPTYLHAACEAFRLKDRGYSSSDLDALSAEQRDEAAERADPRDFK